MKPVNQTIFSSKDDPSIKGNCLTACVASLLEMNIEDVPYWAGMPDHEWGENFWNFIDNHAIRCGWGAYYVGEKMKLPEDSEEEFWNKVKKICSGIDGYYIVCGTSPRGFTAGHAVIYKDGKLAHDPHPSRDGVSKIWSAYLIEKGERPLD